MHRLDLWEVTVGKATSWGGGGAVAGWQGGSVAGSMKALEGLVEAGGVARKKAKLWY